MWVDNADDEPNHTTELEQEGRLLGPAPAAQERFRRSCNRSTSLILGLAAILLLATASYISGRWREARPTQRSSEAVGLAGRGIVNLDITLASLPYRKLSARTDAKSAVEHAVAQIFAGKLPNCQVASEVVAHHADVDATVVQVTLVPSGDESADDIAAFTSDIERTRIGLLLTDAMAALDNITDIATGEVTVSSIEEVMQDGDVQHTIADIPAGSSVIPMGSTTFQTGDMITIVVEDKNGPQQEVIIVSKSHGDFTVQPRLNDAYPVGSMVIRIPPGMRPTQAPTAAPNPAPTPASTPAPIPGAIEAITGSTDEEAAKKPASDVTQVVILSNLPGGELGTEQKAEIEQHVQQAYAGVLGVGTSLVTATVKLPGSRRLRRFAGAHDSVDQTELEVKLEVPQDRSKDELESQLASDKAALESRVVASVETVEGIKAIQTGPIAAACSSHGAAVFPEAPSMAVVLGLLLLAVLPCCLIAWRVGESKREVAVPPESAEGTSPVDADQKPPPAAEAGAPWSRRTPFLEPETSVEGPPPAAEASPPLSQSLPPDEGGAEAAVPAPPEQLGQFTRKDLIYRVFRKFDCDGDDVLNQEELMAFAEIYCEFDGDTEQWAMEYQAICEELEVPMEQGVSASDFEKLISDQALGADEDDQDGEDVISAMYCPDDVLKWVLNADTDRLAVFDDAGSPAVAASPPKEEDADGLREEGP